MYTIAAKLPPHVGDPPTTPNYPPKRQAPHAGEIPQLPPKG